VSTGRLPGKREPRKLVRAYPHTTQVNKTKVDQLEALAVEYRAAATALADMQWHVFYSTGFFDKYGTNLLPHLKTKLSERYKQNLNRQVVGQLKSFLSNRANDCIALLSELTLTPEQSKQLYTIHKYQLWYRHEPTASKIELSRDMVNLARRMLVYVLHQHRRPNFTNCNMVLGINVAQVTDRGKSGVAKKNSATSFHKWAKVSTLDKGKVVYLPINYNPYYESIQGEPCDVLQVNFDRDNGNISLALAKSFSSIAGNYEPCATSIGLDFGLATLLTTDRGDMLGRHFFDVVKKYDRAITKLAAGRQKAKLPVACPKYKNMVYKLRDYIKNEINRCFNRVVDIYQPAQLVVENLNFQNPALSKRLNRILQNCGRSVVRAKLEFLKDFYGIQVVEINPAYTSQTCSNQNCGYVAKNNRPKQSVFKCNLCGNKLNADVNAARNIKHRSSMPELASKYTRKNVILDLLVVFNCNKIEYEKMPSHSRARNLLHRNPYYKGYLDRVQSYSIDFY
jgi:putative transposase